MKCVCYRLGLIDYEEAYGLQKRVWAEKAEGREEDVMLLLEHTPTLTMGKSGNLENLLVDKEALVGEGISLYFTDRGGDITYHGPGQLIAYPIVDLRRRRKDIHRYVHELEEAVIGTLADFSIAGERDEKHVGVWVGTDKICAIGVRVHRWITMHGLALNVSPDLGPFSFITPCGIVERGVTSMAKLLGCAPPMEEVTSSLISHFAGVFSWAVEESAVDKLRCLP
jgi:lipoate-protein ligase B